MFGFSINNLEKLLDRIIEEGEGRLGGIVEFIRLGSDYWKNCVGRVFNCSFVCYFFLFFIIGKGRWGGC